MATIRWTKELRAAATERTRDDLGPEQPVSRSWATLKKVLKRQPNGFNIHMTRFANARKESSPDIVELLDRASAFVMADAMPEKPPDAEAAAYALAAFWMLPGANALFDVLASYGASLVHEAVIQAHGLKPTNVVSNYAVVYFVRAPRDGPIFARELRRALLRADDATRSSCLARAEEIFDGADFHLKTTLCVAHPSRPEWAAAVANAILATPSMRYPPIQHVLMSLATFELVSPLLARRAYVQSLLDLVEPFGERIVPVLMELLEKPKDRHELKHAAIALGVFEGQEIARAFARQLGKKQVREVAIPYFLRYPAVSLPALTELAPGKTKAARLAAQLLQQVERVAAIEATPTEAVPTDEATNEELPWILVSPPWIKSRRGKRTSEEVVKVELLERPETIDLPHEERTRLLGFINASTLPPMTDEEATAWKAGLDRGDTVGLWVHDNKLVPKDLAALAFNEGRSNAGSNVDADAWVALAYIGLDAMPGVLSYLGARFGKGGHRYWMSAIHGVDSPRIAAALLPYLRGAVHRQLVRKWMSEHLESAIIAFVRAAIGGDGEAAIELRAMAEHRARIEAIASEYGEPARKAIDAILDRDPRLDCPQKPPKLPDSWRPETLHRPRLANGKLLPLWALEPIGQMLKFTELTPTYPGLRDVREACDPRSIAELAWSLAEGWELAGAKRKDIWMLESLAHFADDEVTRRTTPALKDPHILRVLGVIGTDAAAMELATIVARTNSPYGADQAETQLGEIAKRRGLTKDELEDRITPTAGLDPSGSTTLDYGSRVLEVGFDTRLEPFVVWESGERQRQLPPKRKSDDAAKVKVAQEKWRDLKEDVATIADRRSKAVERSMLSGRSWSKDEFTRFWVEHPLLVHMAQGIVWSVVENGRLGLGLGRSFRVAEDHTFADQDDATVDVPNDARIVVPHRIELGPADAWLRVFEDYRIVSPIDQLARSVHHPSDEERIAPRVERPLAQPMTYHQIDVALPKIGFHDRAWGGGNMRIGRMLLERSRSTAVIEFPYNAGHVSSVGIRFTRRSGEAIQPGDVHPVEFSEVVRGVASIAPG